MKLNTALPIQKARILCISLLFVKGLSSIIDSKRGLADRSLSGALFFNLCAAGAVYMPLYLWHILLLIQFSNRTSYESESNSPCFHSFFLFEVRL